MNCQENLNKLDDYFDAALDEAGHRAVDDHLAACAACRNTFDEERSIRAALRTLPVAKPGDDFHQRLFENTYAYHKRTARRRYGLGGAIAASFFLVLASTLFFKNTPPPAPGDEHEAIPGMTISLNEVRDVKLIFKSAQNFDKARFTIVLPPGVELDGYPEQSEISWEGRLKKGENLLVLPVVARNPGMGELAAYVVHGDKEKSFRLHMNIDHQESALPSPAVQPA
ncbi:MAG TPA: hypothetical protein ENJ84_03805 [Gammaproteobacteria bacterium]|nr:hypothetical protein [Gammaproteobacteria bacterium]